MLISKHVGWVLADRGQALQKPERAGLYSGASALSTRALNSPQEVHSLTFEQECFLLYFCLRVNTMFQSLCIWRLGGMGQRQSVPLQTRHSNSLHSNTHMALTPHLTFVSRAPPTASDPRCLQCPTLQTDSCCLQLLMA